MISLGLNLIFQHCTKQLMSMQHCTKHNLTCVVLSPCGQLHATLWPVSCSCDNLLLLLCVSCDKFHLLVTSFKLPCNEFQVTLWQVSSYLVTSFKVPCDMTSFKLPCDKLVGENRSSPSALLEHLRLQLLHWLFMRMMTKMMMMTMMMMMMTKMMMMMTKM